MTIVTQKNFFWEELEDQRTFISTDLKKGEDKSKLKKTLKRIKISLKKVKTEFRKGKDGV